MHSVTNTRNINQIKQATWNILLQFTEWDFCTCECRYVVVLRVLTTEQK